MISSKIINVDTFDSIYRKLMQNKKNLKENSRIVFEALD